MKERLFSLDLLRGLDMFLLTVVGPFVSAFSGTVALPKALMDQFNHAYGGFVLWDIIMPLFIFMCGAAVPFGLGKRLRDGKPTPAYWKHVVSRFALLWFLGLIAQGRLLTLDLLRISPFNNTLQAIACGYLIAAVVTIIPSRKVQIAMPIALAVGYGLALHLGGDYSRTGNVAIRFEDWFVRLILPTGSRALELADPWYSWWFTIPMFGAMTLCGAEATRILTADEPKMRRFAKLLALGAILLAVGWALVPWVPSVKHVFTFTFTAQAMGWSCLALAILFYLSDILMFRRGLGLFILFGQTALLAYMTVEVFACVPNAFADRVTGGFAQAFGAKTVPLARWFFATVFLVTILHFRNRRSERSPQANVPLDKASHRKLQKILSPRGGCFLV